MLKKFQKIQKGQYKVQYSCVYFCESLESWCTPTFVDFHVFLYIFTMEPC